MMSLQADERRRRDFAVSAPKVTDCKTSLDCRIDGKCSSEAGVCKALSDEDCAQSRVCQSQGRCSAAGGVCTKPTQSSDSMSS